MATVEEPEAMVDEQTENKGTAPSNGQNSNDVSVAPPPEVLTEQEDPQRVSEETSSEDSEHFGERNVSMLMDVELNVTVELGRKQMSIAEILKLGKGTVIELAKAAGEPLDIYINGTRMARGEVVVIDEQFAVRITELASPKERIKSLG
ncbi:MAG: flagellar motor switch protein FliN [Calditrichia bacterium]